MLSVYARIHKLACQCHGNSTASYLETSAGSGFAHMLSFLNPKESLEKETYH